MSILRHLIPALALVVLSGGLLPAEEETRPAKDTPSFGLLTPMEESEAQTKAEAWLKKASKMDKAAQAKFASIWKEDRPILDRVARTLALGDTNAAKVLEEARDRSAVAPTEVPSLLKDKKVDGFLRANLALAYGKALAQRRIYEQALEALKQTNADLVVDPAAYLFCKAVCQHALMDKTNAEDSIDRLLVDVPASPERYRMVAALMHFDMLAWKEKDLGWVSRKMDVIKDRLDLTRGGKKTQRMQKEVLIRLDEMIKEMENKASGCSQCNGGGCPGGGQPGSNPNNTTNPSAPQQDSFGGTGSGPGKVDMKKVKEYAEVWGKLPPKKRAKAMAELTRNLPPKYRQAIENYVKELQRRGR